MLFNSLGYLVFLPTVVLLFWLVPKFLRSSILLIASYVFYMVWKPIYGLLIFGLTAVNYVFGLAIAKNQKHKKLLLIVAVSVNLLTLAYFKYAYFTVDLLSQIGAPLGIHLPPLAWQIILPLGISFFVFEFIHYVVDVYRGGKPVRSFIDFALFASFFPTQIAGPIKRYQDFIPQLAVKDKFKLQYFDEGMWLILFGLFKKVLFADNLAVVVNSAFANPELLTGADLWLAVYAFAFQIYFDFSGYTDMARGSAMLFGYKVPLNFNLPYLAGSIAEFWHRWHISLSTWLRDYLYIPLGGSRCSRFFNWRNLFLTMALGGLWHGASMHFFAWGAYQGIALILHKELKAWMDSQSWLANIRTSAWFHVLSVVFTFHVVCIGWVFFRAETMDSALSIIGKLLAAPFAALTMVNVQEPVIFMILPFVLLLLVTGQIVSGYLASRQEIKVPLFVRAVCVSALIALLIVFTPDTSPRFIYFQF
ncbi:MAG: hypothetical protein K2W82_08635 [Candidatus Obscuribacterales bacterium]|nr:hypothetical protein [Candidatus Obscuribacterales bacterium]